MTSHRVPFSVAELGATGHADVHARSVDLHERDAVLQGQNEPVHSFFGVPVENHTFGVKGAQLKGRLDAAGNQETVSKAGGRAIARPIKGFSLDSHLPMSVRLMVLWISGVQFSLS